MYVNMVMEQVCQQFQNCQTVTEDEDCDDKMTVCDTVTRGGVLDCLQEVLLH